MRSERETVIRWDEAEQVVHLWSASPVVWRKASRLGFEVVKETTRDGQPVGRTFLVPLARFRWGARGQAKGRGNPEVLRSWRQAKQRARDSQNANGEVPAWG